MKRSFLLAIVALGAAAATSGGQAVPPKAFTRADTVRGSNTPERTWWDAAFYDLHVKVNPGDSSIVGYNAITYRVLKAAREMQIDLQMPLVIDSVVQDGTELSARRDGNAFFIKLITRQPIGARKQIAVYYHGKPVAALRLHWDGGFVSARYGVARALIAFATGGFCA